MGRMKKVETAAGLKDEKLFKLIRNYLLVCLPVQREASPHTVTDYRTVLSQYLSFAAEKNGIILFFDKNIEKCFYCGVLRRAASAAAKTVLHGIFKRRRRCAAVGGTIKRLNRFIKN